MLVYYIWNGPVIEHKRMMAAMRTIIIKFVNLYIHI